MPDPGGPPRRFPSRRRAFRVEADAVVRSVKRRLEQITQDRNRGEWMRRRLERYAKYRGWYPEKTYPWEGAANTHPPLLQIGELRANAGIHNVTMGMRPLVHAVATRRADLPKADRITNLIDAQLFVDPGPEAAERRFSDSISLYLQDGNWVALTPWVRDARETTWTHYLPELSPEADVDRAILTTLARIFPDARAIRAITPARWEIDRAGGGLATADAFEDDEGAIQLVLRATEVLHDGPAFINFGIDRVFVPTRCANLQPPSDANPEGAPYVFLLTSYRLDDLARQRGRSRGFNVLDADGFEKIRLAARAAAGQPVAAPETEEMQEQKDTLEGREHATPAVEIDPEFGHLPVPALLCFDRWDIDGRGTATDVYWVVARDADVLMEARLLTDKWPSRRPYRPFAEACAIPVPQRYYGISFLELGEALQDLVKGTLDQTFDSASVANLPFFFYAASAQVAAEQIRLAPGTGYPVPGNPRETTYFPAVSGRDQSWGFSVIALAIGFYDRLMSLGPLQAGQVPTGKASALRTYGTTAALLQQGDVRADQLLLRYFGGVRQLARNFHSMNRHLLPRGKEIRILGYEGPREQGYTVVEPDDLDAEMDFDFRPDFLLSNQQLLTAAIERVLTLVATPLAFQLGITDAPRFYELVKDYVRAARLDPKKYLRPPAEDGAPPILFEEALSLILENEVPVGPPLEGPEAHLAKAFEFIKSEGFTGNPEQGLAPIIRPEQVNILRAWLSEVGRRRQQQLAVAAARESLGTVPPQGMPTAGGEPGLPAQPEPQREAVREQAAVEA